jgi:hypothetical protein
VKKDELVAMYEHRLMELHSHYGELIDEAKRYQSAREGQLVLQLADRQRECERLTQFAQAFNLDVAVQKVIDAIHQDRLLKQEVKVLTAEQRYLQEMRRGNLARQQQEHPGGCGSEFHYNCGPDSPCW